MEKKFFFRVLYRTLLAESLQHQTWLLAASIP